MNCGKPGALKKISEFIYFVVKIEIQVTTFKMLKLSLYHFELKLKIEIGSSILLPSIFN